MTEQAATPRATTPADYEPIIKALRPWMPADELRSRSGLMWLRDKAMADG
jgi:hypothetical protein